MLAKEAMSNYGSMAINYSTQTKDINYKPLWNDILIDGNLRAFIKITSEIRSFASFINLHRNNKYRTLDVDWNNMFKMLNIRENQDFPTFEDMNLKLRKLKILFEEV
ncbi:unnamed protein product [Rhizophagus irregularis]|nr:unnamed protein product [Rhizophagus irregularis]